MATETRLADWLLGQIGPNRRFKSARQLSIAAGMNQNVVGILLEGGGCRAETLVRLAKALEVRPSHLFVLAGWLTEDQLEGEQLSSEEERFLQMFRSLDEERRRPWLEVGEALLEPTDLTGRHVAEGEVRARNWANRG